ncbi:AraC family transcriptional regulator [Clostridiales bacterium COT073_COT-073]|nr:AraC family transcriptional regulator [Clostridiales bacterium COT073_COT-073]
MKMSFYLIPKLIHSRHFKTALWMLLLLSHCFIVVGLLFWANQFQTAATERAGFRLTSLLNQSERMLNTSKDNALFAGALPTVQNSLLVSAPTIDQLMDLSKDLSPFINLMAYESFTIYFSQSDLIYDSKAGLYEAGNFYNPQLLERFGRRTEEEYWEFGHPYQRFYDNFECHHTLTYLHSLPLFGMEKYGFIAVNLPLTGLNNCFRSYTAEFEEQIFLYFEDKLLWSNQPFTLYQTTISADQQYSAAPSVSLASASFPMLRGEIYFPRSFLLNELSARLPWLLLFYFPLLALNFGGALIYSYYHINKLDIFLKKIGMEDTFSLSGDENPVSAFPYLSLSGKEISVLKPKAPAFDEFQLLNKAAEHLQNQITNIKNTIINHKPLLQERLLTNILYHHIEVDAIPAEYAEYDISFPHPYFCIVLMAIQEIESVGTTTIKEEIKLVAKQNACQLFSGLGKVYSIYSEKENLLFLINTPVEKDLQEQIYSIAVALRSGMRESLGFHLLFSVAFCDTAHPVPYYAWTKARKNLIFTSGSTDSFIIFSHQENYATALMPSFIFQITQAIIDKNSRRLQDLMENFYQQNLPDSTPAATARKTLLLAAFSVFSSLLEMDVFFPIEDMNQIVRQIEQNQDLEQSKKLFYHYLSGLIDADNKIPREAQSYINKTISYLEIHFAEPVTVTQIAENVNISPIYLNKLFKLSTGKTLSEYLNFYRIEKSKNLLLDTDLTINDISKALGYNDVRSYIRFFKKFYDITPNHFRKTRLM